jgi:hypothetical protein
MTSRAESLRAEHVAAGDAAGSAAAARRAELRELHRRGELVSAGDKLAAVVVWMDSDDAGDVQLAHDVALAAMGKEPSARPLAAFAFDRLRLLAGRPQKFGTQVVVRDGRRVLWEVDATTTDSERAKWGVPGLAELVRAVAVPRS